MTHTYKLIEARISIEAGKIKNNNHKKKQKTKNKKNEKKKRKNEIARFPKLLLCVSFSFLFSLGKSSKFVLFFFFSL